MRAKKLIPTLKTLYKKKEDAIQLDGQFSCNSVVYFGHRLGALHSKGWSISAFLRQMLKALLLIPQTYTI